LPPVTALQHSYASLVGPLHEHVAAFLGLDAGALGERMATARQERNRRWIEADPRTEEERDRLYASLGELDLLKYAEWHVKDEEKHRLHDWAVSLAQRQGARVLDCGGGIGDTTLAFAANGVPVTYVDFPGVCSDFARERWRRFRCEDRVEALSPQDFWTKNDGSFGLIASFDVLEHLENPVRHAARYAELLRPGGSLVITTCFRHSRRNPDHLAENDAYHRLFGGEKRTARRCALTNLGMRRRRWYHFERP
jgi:2-polyprenyl-3-methyl-5-hydroxy-6-metoxy-1,4-benzoquinol methylase